MNPERSIIIAGVQRSGTSFLCDALQKLGNVGLPAEHFVKMVEPQWIENKEIEDIRNRIETAIQEGSTANGIFGLKIMWNTYCDFMKIVKQLPELKTIEDKQIFQSLFGNITYIWIRRRDKTRQAVSWAKAAQTGKFSLREGNETTPTIDLQFNFQFISNLYKLTEEGETGWASYFEAIKADVVKVYYEDLVNNVDQELALVMDHCQLDKNVSITTSDIIFLRQSDTINEEWVERFNESSTN